MGSGALETNRFTNGEAENGVHKQVSPAPAALDNSLSDANNGVTDPDVVCVCSIVYQVFVIAS